MHLLALATTLSQPPDDAVAGTLPIGHHAKQLVQALAGERLGGKRQLLLVPQFQLPQRLADRQEAVIGALAAVSGPVGDVDDLGPFLVGDVRLAVDPPDQRLLTRSPASQARPRGKLRSHRRRSRTRSRRNADLSPRRNRAAIRPDNPPCRSAARPSSRSPADGAGSPSARATARDRRARCRRGTPSTASRPVPPTSSSAADTP